MSSTPEAAAGVLTIATATVPLRLGLRRLEQVRE